MTRIVPSKILSAEPGQRAAAAAPLARRLKLRQVSLALAISDARSLRVAAERLSMSQPAATRMLQDLEWALGVRLFERSARGMAPTLAGQTALLHMHRAIRDIEAIQGELDALSKGATGRVRIGTLGSVASLLLPRSIAVVKAGAPAVIFEIIEGPHDVLVTALRTGELDAALCRALDDTQAPDLLVELLLEETFTVVTGAGGRRQRGKRALASLVDEPWVLPPRGVPVRQRLDAAFLGGAGRVPHDIIESASLLVNQQLLEGSRRFGVMPELVAAHYARRGLVARVATDLSGVRGPIALVTLKGRAPRPAAAAFQNALRKVAAEMGATPAAGRLG